MPKPKSSPLRDVNQLLNLMGNLLQGTRLSNSGFVRLYHDFETQGGQGHSGIQKYIAPSAMSRPHAIRRLFGNIETQNKEESMLCGMIGISGLVQPTELRSKEKSIALGASSFNTICDADITQPYGK